MLSTENKLKGSDKLHKIIQLFGGERILDQIVPEDIVDNIYDSETSNLTLCGIAMKYSQEQIIITAVSQLLSRSPDDAELAIAFTCLEDKKSNQKLKERILSQLLDSNPETKILSFLSNNCQNQTLNTIITANLIRLQREKRINAKQGTILLTR